MSTIVTAAVIVGAGAGVALYGSYSSSQAQKQAAANNTYLTNKQADATLAVSTYQADLNKKIALAQADIADQNASVYHAAARSSENLGFMQESRQLMQEGQAASQTRADFGASGIEGDTGSPLAVAAHNAAIGQMTRMDTAYQTNLSAMNEDWQGALATYQSTLGRETATQYDYAKQMAEWTDKATKAGAIVQQGVADQMGTAALISGIGQSISSIGGAVGSYGATKAYSARTPNPSSSKGSTSGASSSGTA